MIAPLPFLSLLPLRDHRRIDLVEDLHEHPGHRHQDEIAIDDVAELMRHDGAGFILAQELEQSLGHHDAGVGAQQAIGEGRRIAVGDEADARRREAVVLRHLMDQLMHAGITLLHRGIVEEDELVEPTERHIRQPRADQPDDEIDDDGEDDGDAEVDLARRDHGGQDHAGDHADEQAEGDQRREDETKHDDPSKGLGDGPRTIAGRRRCRLRSDCRKTGLARLVVQEPGEALGDAVARRARHALAAARTAALDRSGLGELFATIGGSNRMASARRTAPPPCARHGRRGR